MKYVMIIPLRRCGSNAIRLRLDLHPDIFAPYPLHIHDFVPLVSRFGDLSVDENYLRLVIDVIGYFHTSPVRWPSFAPDPLRLFETLCQDNHRSIYRIVYEIYRQGATERGAQVIVDKSQDSVLEWREWIQAIPDILFLDIIRDPRAQIASMNNCVLHDFHTQLNLDTWLYRRALVDEIRSAYPEKIISVRYEDFVNDPTRFMHYVCGFIGIPYISSVMDVTVSDEARRMSIISPLWENNDSIPVRSSLQKYLDTLSFQDIQKIQTATDTYMTRYEYLVHDFDITTNASTDCHDIIEENAERKTKFLLWLRNNFPGDYWMRMCRWHYLETQTVNSFMEKK